jgi:hypothetical protein
MRRIPSAAVALVALASLAIPAGAAALTTVGQLAPGNPPAVLCDITNQNDLWQQEVSSGISYVIPSPGVITSWSTNASAGKGQIYSFRIIRPLTHERFLVVAHDTPKVLTPEKLNTFKTTIPVKAGDLLGFNYNPSMNPNTACFFEAAGRQNVLTVRQGDTLTLPDPPDGDVIESFFAEHELRLNVSATLLPSPTIASLNPASGDAAGGSAVAIAGANFAEVKSVTFGGVAAKSFKVDSEAQISAIAPPGSPGQVPLTITTLAGSATSIFSYASETPPPQCLVPKLKGKKLKAAKKGLKKAGCGLGKVKLVHGARSATGRVAQQRPKPGTVRPAGAKVNVTVSGADVRFDEERPWTRGRCCSEAR